VCRQERYTKQMKKALGVPDVARKHQPKYGLEVLKEFPELYKWLKELSRYRKLEDYIYISDYKKGEIRVKIFTKDHCYTIVAILPSEKRLEGYFGTYANCRKARAGEDWTRGSDLPDGEYKRETWERFIAAMVSYEMVKVVRNSPDEDEK